MGHAPPRVPNPIRPSPMRGYYPPSFPPCDCAERYRKHQARRLGVFLGGLVCAALGVLVGEVLAVLGVTVALCAVLSPPSPTIVTAHRRRPERKQMTSARWLSEPPLEIPGVSESDVRVYHRRAVTALMDDRMTPTEFEEALDRLWHDPEAALAETRAQMAPERRPPPPPSGRGGWQKPTAPPSEEARARLRGLPPKDAIVAEASRGVAEAMLEAVRSGALIPSPEEIRAVVGLPPLTENEARAVAGLPLTEEEVQREISGDYVTERSPFPRPRSDALERRRT